jgi:cbb3-type cytochrome oxidase subunit 3
MTPQMSTDTEDTEMTWFLFIGDMLVMLFMVVLVVWVSTSATRASLDYSARIPLGDDGVPPVSNAKTKEQGA